MRSSVTVGCEEGYGTERTLGEMNWLCIRLVEEVSEPDMSMLAAAEVVEATAVAERGSG